ncbi:Hypothetical predicted protein [Podarcis lilfordi]|uniref:Uncharacterized protein n=1 Tax=Podarcis lilfordi TaxID=74358 RepID=A0AA35KK20_9SAUR|nr:Hypothetical predicted protein [Podarcis lilfordi]
MALGKLSEQLSFGSTPWMRPTLSSLLFSHWLDACGKRTGQIRTQALSLLAASRNGYLEAYTVPNCGDRAELSWLVVTDGLLCPILFGSRLTWWHPCLLGEGVPQVNCALYEEGLSLVCPESSQMPRLVQDTDPDFKEPRRVSCSRLALMTSTHPVLMSFTSSPLSALPVLLLRVPQRRQSGGGGVGGGPEPARALWPRATRKEGC